METIDIQNGRRVFRLTLPNADVTYFDTDHPASHGGNSYLEHFSFFLADNNWHRFIQPGSTVIDIGAHTGDTIIPMQYLAQGTVLAIEPIPSNKQVLDMNAEANKHLGKFITAAEAVTTDNIAEIEIFDHNNGLLNGGIIDDSWSNELQRRMGQISTQSIKVEGLTLASICKKYLSDVEIDNISFIKTDTEGHDVSILDSSREFIDRIRPVIFMEWFANYTHAENQHQFDIIEQIGYLAFDPKTLEPAKIDQVIPDLILIHKSKINEYL